MRKFSACLQEVFPPTEQAFFHPWKNTASKMGHCITSIPLYMNRQRHEFPLFLKGRAAHSVIKNLTQQVCIPSSGSPQVSGDRSAGAVLLSARELCRPSLLHTGTHSQSPGKPLPASVLAVFETLNGVFESALT